MNKATKTSSTKKCPFCAEEVKTEAIKCKHCGESLDTQSTQKNVKADGKKQQPCPKCGSFNTIKVKWLTMIIGLVFAAGGAFLSFLVFPIVLVPIGLILMLIAPFLTGKKWYCNGCKYKFVVEPIKS